MNAMTDQDIRDTLAVLEEMRANRIRNIPVQALRGGYIGLKEGAYGLVSAIELSANRAWLRRIDVPDFDDSYEGIGPIQRKEISANG